MALSNPLALLLILVPVGAVLYFLLRRRSPSRTLPFSGLSELLAREIRKTRWIFRALCAFFVVGLALLSYAIARPYLSRPLVKKTGEGIDIVIVQDVSESMDADDFEPNRMTVARAVIRDFIRKRTEDRIGLVAFSGDAVTKCPLTRDYDFLLAQVDELKMRELKQGTAIGMGLANGIARLRGSEARTKVIILLTDGDSNVGTINPITAAHLAKQDSIKIYTIGIGKANRVVVPIYAYDIFGKRTQLIAQVPSYLNPDLLKEIARITGGKAYMARDSGMLSRMLQEINQLEKTKVKIQRTEERDEKFLIPTLLGLFLLMTVSLLQETRFRRYEAA